MYPEQVIVTSNKTATDENVQAKAPYLVTVQRQRSSGVAVAALAALPAGQVPVGRSTLTTVLTHHIGQTGALTAHPVTLPAVGIRTDWVTDAL